MSLAEAIRDLIEEDVQAPAITIADPQPDFFHVHYRLLSRYALRLWAAEFQFFDTSRRALLAHRVFTRLVRRQLNALLDTIQPDLILTTYPFLSYEVRHTLEQRSSKVPLILLISDANTVHASWLTERQVTATFAPTQETYEQALAAGFAPERVYLVGWPVRAQFLRDSLSSREIRTEQLARLHLAPNRFTIFLQGGGEGAAHVDRTLENILAISSLTNNVQVILAAGTNAALQERYKHARNLAILPYTKEAAPFMAAADIIMGKAGPNVLFESVMLGKPFIATTYIPGQEQANLSFIQDHGLGWVAIQPEEQRSLLTALTRNVSQFREMSATINAYRQWNAEMMKRIVPCISSLLPSTALKRRSSTSHLQVSLRRNEEA